MLIEGPAWLHSKGLSLLSFRKAKGISEGGQQLRGAHECSSPEHRGTNHTIGCRYPNHQAFRALLLGPRELHPICRQAKAMHIEQVELSGCFSIMARAGCSSLYDAHSEPCLPSTNNAQ